jgi:hypothetical protein
LGFVIDKSPIVDENLKGLLYIEHKPAVTHQKSTENTSTSTLQPIPESQNLSQI